jgi:hypothetical protein
VGTGVVEIFTLEPNLCSTNRLGQPASVIERAGATNETLQQSGQFSLELSILSGTIVFFGKLVQGASERLGYKSAAKAAKTASIVGNGWPAWSRTHR